MNIRIETISHGEQRYPTAGDWFFDKNKDLVIRVSALGDWRSEALLAVHELIEALLCTHQGISPHVVDSFDLLQEKLRSEGNEDETGDDPSCPYKRQHCVATGVERLLAAELEVDWRTYEKKLFAL